MDFELINNKQLCDRFNPVNQNTNSDLGNPTCLLDVIFLPIPALVLAVLVALSLIARRKSIAAGSWQSEKHESLVVPPSRAMVIMHWLDLALVFCEGGVRQSITTLDELIDEQMQILEIARLAISNEGVGLLPSRAFPPCSYRF